MIGVVCTRFTFVIGVDGQEFALSRPARVWVWVKYYEPFCNCNCTALEKLAAISMTSGRICSRLCHEESCHIAEAIARLSA
jgi:hypothetical protein